MMNTLKQLFNLELLDELPWNTLNLEDFVTFTVSQKSSRIYDKTNKKLSSIDVNWPRYLSSHEFVSHRLLLRNFFVFSSLYHQHSSTSLPKTLINSSVEVITKVKG